MPKLRAVRKKKKQRKKDRKKKMKTEQMSKQRKMRIQNTSSISGPTLQKVEEKRNDKKGTK